jgi:hypothetical protein
LGSQTGLPHRNNSDSDSKAFSNSNDSNSDSDDEESPDGWIEHGIIRTIDNGSPNGRIEHGQMKVKPNDKGDIPMQHQCRRAIDQASEASGDEAEQEANTPGDSVNHADTHINIDTGVNPNNNNSLQHAMGSP